MTSVVLFFFGFVDFTFLLAHRCSVICVSGCMCEFVCVLVGVCVRVFVCVCKTIVNASQKTVNFQKVIPSYP